MSDLLLASELAEVVAELIPEFGVAVPFVRIVSGEYDTTTGKTADDQTLTMSPMCVTENKGRWIDGVVKGEKYLLFAAEGLTFAPEPGDKFTHNGGFTIMEKGVLPVEVQGQVIAYEVWGISG